MGHLFEIYDVIKRYTRFSAREIRAGLITILTIAFSLSFRKWGIGADVDLALGLINFLGAALIVAVSFFARQAFQKAWALGTGYQAEYRMWSFGILLMLLLVFLTNGRLWFLIPGGVVIHYMKGHRIGWVRYGLNWFGMGFLSMMGPFANIALAYIFRGLFDVFRLELFKMGFLLNLIWGLWTMIPIPPADGGRMLLGSRLAYMYGLGVVVFSSILLYANINIFLSLIGSIIFAAIWWLIYYVIWERFNWKGPY